ncbi:restriction endonuclease [Flavobacterium tibetense]|jgi:hypothetical protein|uniref:ATP-cone domain-containing protein n=1 Tax=Flavobacterium tibetense TaxID=2233533 RepID=A0A365P4E9_9FLAO|nr:restriction endonuclease [Flavobacterium tibetense]RBA29468.1 hypothetical protein DPN68_02150 [Flavobacterium tibetense]
MKIKKYSGEIVEFDKEKLIKSLMNAGSERGIAEQILFEITPQLHEGITSKKIARLAFQKLKSRSKAIAARYNLKSGLIALGPAGFYFEKFIARLFELQGFQTRSNVFVDGNCVSHELDIVVKKDNHLAMVECKFHSGQEIKSDVKVPMYILSRFNDVNQNQYRFFETDEQLSKCWIVTNNKFTSEAIKFAECSGIHLLSWDYPQEKNLKNLTQEFRLYPITCLTTLTIAEKELLLLQDILTVYDLTHHPKKFKKLRISQSRMKNILTECQQLLHKNIE